MRTQNFNRLCTRNSVKLGERTRTLTCVCLTETPSLVYGTVGRASRTALHELRPRIGSLNTDQISTPNFSARIRDSKDGGLSVPVHTLQWSIERRNIVCSMHTPSASARSPRPRMAQLNQLRLRLDSTVQYESVPCPKTRGG